MYTVCKKGLKNMAENIRCEIYCQKGKSIYGEFSLNSGVYEKDGIRADVMVIDPPRKGCGAACLETMLLMEPERIVYVSCDPATLARDLKILCADGRYELVKVQPVDMFPHTAGVETVCLLSKLNAK